MKSYRSYRVISLHLYNLLLFLWTIIGTSTASNPWDKYNYSPKSRTIYPSSVYNSTTFTLTSSIFPTQLNTTNRDIVLDFGKEVGGYTTIEFGHVSSASSVTLFWSESSLYIQTGDGSRGDNSKVPDGGITIQSVQSHSTWTASDGELRGGFRYLRIVSNAGTNIQIKNVSLYFTASPHIQNLNDYKNYFYSSDDLVNQIWYGCAYTVQLCSISSAHGRQWPPPKNPGWANNASCVAPSVVGQSVLVDGAKRDRTIWPGDMGVSTKTAFVTTGDTYPSRISLETLYAYQSKDGMLPYAGPPVDFFDNSDTYHLWALIGTCNFFHHTSNISWLRTYWNGFQNGINASLRKINNITGLMVVDKKADWQRCCQGGENIAANSLLYNVLVQASSMALSLNNTILSMQYQQYSITLKNAINTLLWDDEFGAYRDNPTSTLHPQDGNSLANWFGVADTNRSLLVSNYLYSNWGKYGSASPEWNNGQSIGTFSGSMEVFSHFSIGQSKRALNLIKLQWGYMLNSKISTKSTFWEGYNADGTFNFDGVYMSHAHGWSSGPGGALTNSVLGIRADDNITNNGITPFIVAPQTSGLQWCEGRLTFDNDNNSTHQIDVQWNMTMNRFTLKLNLDYANENAIGRVELPLFTDSNVNIKIDGTVVARLNVSNEEFNPRHIMYIPIPLRSHTYVVEKQ